MTFDFTFSYRFLVLDLTRDISISLANYQWIEHGGLYWKADGGFVVRSQVWEPLHQMQVNCGVYRED